MLKQTLYTGSPADYVAATFGWLCVETLLPVGNGVGSGGQPPSGGCVLKLEEEIEGCDDYIKQPPSGGCVLKHFQELANRAESSQPPSGGCVLKLYT